MMQRFRDWATRLEAFLGSGPAREFRYGEFDCCLFVCDAIYVMTGADPAELFRGRYSNRRQARKLLARAGGVAAVAARYGLPEIPVPLAGRGDVLLMKPSALGLVALNGRDALVLTDAGIGRRAAAGALRAWRV
jgi:Domain of unknown function (DUF6950)